MTCDRKMKVVGGGDEYQAIKAIGTFKRQLITRQGLAADDVAQVISEVLERAKRAGFCVQMGEVETPATWLAPAMVADVPIEAALQPAGQIEIGAVDRQDQRVVSLAREAPDWQNKLDTDREASV